MLLTHSNISFIYLFTCRVVLGVIGAIVAKPVSQRQRVRRSGKILLLVEMERIDWQTQQSTTGERGTDTHKKHDNKLLWLYHRHQYQHHYYIQQISIPGAWGILEIFVILRYLRLYLSLSPLSFTDAFCSPASPKCTWSTRRKLGNMYLVWYVGAWFGWKDNTYHPK